MDASSDSARRTARLAGAVYVTLGVLTAFGYYHAPLVQADPSILAGTLAHASSLRFGIAVVADVLSAALAIPLGLLLYRLFESVDRPIAVLMALLLIIAVPISFALATQYVTARMWLVGGDLRSAFSPEQRTAYALTALRVHAHGVLAVEIFWGLWLLPLGSLILRSRFLPRAIGVLLLIAGTAYVFHSIVSLLWPGMRLLAYERITMLARAAGEFPVMLWLLLRAADVRDEQPTSRAGSS
jgi:hypothetical protein